jgi:hypothetical protein
MRGILWGNKTEILHYVSKSSVIVFVNWICEIHLLGGSIISIQYVGWAVVNPEELLV